MKRLGFLGIMATALALGACGGEPIVDRAFSYIGVVSDSATGQLLDSVFVSVGDSTSTSVRDTTDSFGEFSITNFLVPVAQLTFRKQNYKMITVATNTSVLVDTIVVIMAK